MLILDWGQLFPIGSVVLLAYIVFSLVGFGSALIAAPLLVHAVPVSVAVPLLAILDCIISLYRGVNLNKYVVIEELKILLPAMLLGNIVGAFILFSLSPQLLMLGMGIFVVAYALFSLARTRVYKPLRRIFAWLFGALGGVFSIMFGSGGFIYAAYLSRRITSVESNRATQSVVISFSTLSRVLIFAFAGVYFDRRILLLILFLLPLVFCGEFVGSKISTRLSLDGFKRVLHIMLVFSGVSLIIRYFLRNQA